MRRRAFPRVSRRQAVKNRAAWDRLFAHPGYWFDAIVTEGLGSLTAEEETVRQDFLDHRDELIAGPK